MSSPLVSHVITDEKKDMGKLVAQLAKVKADRAKVSSELADLKAQEELLTQEALEQMEEMGVDQLRIGNQSLSRSKKIVPSVDDWDQFWAYIVKEKAYHLLQRRPAEGAYRELRATGEDVPGANDFEKESLSVRKV